MCEFFRFVLGVFFFVFVFSLKSDSFLILGHDRKACQLLFFFSLLGLNSRIK